MPRRWWLAAWALLLVTLASGTLLRIQWMGAVPAFVHLHLLTFVTAALVLLLFRIEWPAGVLFLGGVWTMVAVLLGVGVFELLGRPVFWPVQQVLAGTAPTPYAFR